MHIQHLIRVGIFGHVGRFASVAGARYARGWNVVCRTSRGLEIGEVLTVGGAAPGLPDGTVLRRVTVSDELLLARLERHKQQAFRACQQLLEERRLPAVLVDVEHLFDGGSLYFYFLGQETPELERLTAELAETYDAEVQFRRFAQSVEAGCGPSCGTEQAEGSGCGTGGCGSCALSGACGTRSPG